MLVFELGLDTFDFPGDLMNSVQKSSLLDRRQILDRVLEHLALVIIHVRKHGELIESCGDHDVKSSLAANRLQPGTEVIGRTHCFVYTSGTNRTETKEK